MGVGGIGVSEQVRKELPAHLLLPALHTLLLPLLHPHTPLPTLPSSLLQMDEDINGRLEAEDRKDTKKHKKMVQLDKLGVSKPFKW